MVGRDSAETGVVAGQSRSIGSPVRFLSVLTAASSLRIKLAWRAIASPGCTRVPDTVAVTVSEPRVGGELRQTLRAGGVNRASFPAALGFELGGQQRG